MTDVLRIKRRALGGSAGAPASLAVGELAFNEQDGGLYIGRSNGSIVQINAAAGGGASITISDTPPSSPSPGALWWESDSGSLWIYYNDGNTSQWVGIAAATGGSGGGSGGGFTTGDLKPTHKTVADAGWILWKDGTIGDGSSGAGLRANDDTAALFTLYYAYTDAQCPLLTSTGSATTRAAQGTAAAAYAAHCRMTLPTAEGRGLGIAGSGSGLTARSAPVGGSGAMNIMNPTTYINVMIKL